MQPTREHMTPSEIEQWENSVFTPYDPVRRRYRHDISQPEVLARLRPFLVTQRNQHLRKTSRDHFTAEEIKAWEDADPLTWNERIARLCCPAQQNLDESEVKVVPKNVWSFFQDFQYTPSKIS